MSATTASENPIKLGISDYDCRPSFAFDWIVLLAIYWSNHRMPGDVESRELPSSVASNQEHKQTVKCHRWDHAQVDCGNRISMISQKYFSVLRWGFAPRTWHLAIVDWATGRLGDWATLKPSISSSR
jgi:hypothetical protein